MEVSFDVQLQPKDLFRFNMYQTYTGMQGILSIVLGILGFVMAGMPQRCCSNTVPCAIRLSRLGVPSGEACAIRYHEAEKPSQLIYSSMKTSRRRGGISFSAFPPYI